MLSIHSIIALIIIFFILLFLILTVYSYNKKLTNNKIYIIISVFIVIFIILFIYYNERNIKIYEQSLNKINNMYNIQYYDINSIISNHSEINKRIIFLEERIAHYQNNSNNFASLWLSLLSVLFITVTGFNLYNYNEKKKELDKLIKSFKKKGSNAIKNILNRANSSNNNIGATINKGGHNVS